MYVYYDCSGHECTGHEDTADQDGVLSHSRTYRPLKLLFGSLFLQGLLLEGLACGRGGWQVLWTETEALEKLENVTVLLLEQGH